MSVQRFGEWWLDDAEDDQSAPWLRHDDYETPVRIHYFGCDTCLDVGWHEDIPLAAIKALIAAHEAWLAKEGKAP